MSVKVVLFLLLAHSLWPRLEAKETIKRTSRRHFYNRMISFYVDKGNADRQLELTQDIEDNIYSRTNSVPLGTANHRIKRQTEERRFAFICADNIDHSVPFPDVCNGLRDCEDGSDERNCKDFMCPELFYTCKSGGCLELNFQCDGGKVNCNDQSDETNCRNATCPDGFFRCKSGQCVVYPYRCDGENDCNDKSDELECDNITCPDDYYRCSDGRCMSYKYICDHAYPNLRDIDCGNMTCDMPNYTCVDKLYFGFQCNNGFCMSPERRCNVDEDCPEGDDEVSCEIHTCYRPQLQFQCGTGQCIPNNKRCNTRIECPDGSDEINCYNFVCPDSHLRCASGTCFPVEEQCDGVPYCLHGSDEENCHNSTCPGGYFRCNTGQCVLDVFRCDGVMDCVDTSDELGCDNVTCQEQSDTCSDGRCIKHRRFICEYSYSSLYPSLKNCRIELDNGICANYTCESKADFQCDNGECVPSNEKCNWDILCTDGSDEKYCCDPYAIKCCDYGSCDPPDLFLWCVELRYQCDGLLYCPNNFDEMNCQNKTCPEGYFHCDSSRCIHHVGRCDDYKACIDGTDELDCDNMECPEHYHTCQNGACISRLEICDEDNKYAILYRTSNIWDCFLDEELSLYNHSCHTYTCGSTESFQCNDGRCFGSFRRCDMFVDCDDGEDEIGCNFQTCPNDRFLCLGGCFANRHRCDGRQHCPDNSDEEDCHHATCSHGFFRCKSGQCIVYAFRCDGLHDCADDSDELDCDSMKCPPDYYTCSDGRCMNNLVCEFAYTDWELRYGCSDELNMVACLNYSCMNQDDFQCTSGDCVPSNYRCNELPECLDSSDEIGCFEGKVFLCKNGKMIIESLMCNYKVDCSDGSDENDCADYKCTLSGSVDGFKCPISGKCIPNDYRCDYKHDCMINNAGVIYDWDTTDEDFCIGDIFRKCSASEFPCMYDNGQHYYVSKCISLQKGLCNGYFIDEQCGGFKFDDEAFCPFRKCPSEYLRLETGGCIKPENTSCTTVAVDNSVRCSYQCPSDRYIRCCDCCSCRCVHRVSICDGIKDCPAGEDEIHCGKPECRSDQFYCDSSDTCFPLELQCDGFEQCPNSTDETGCWVHHTTRLVKFAVPLTKSRQICEDSSICLTFEQVCAFTGACPMKFIDDDFKIPCFFICKDPCECSQVGIMHCHQWGNHNNVSANNTSNPLWPFETTDYDNEKDPIKAYFTMDVLSMLSITNASLTQVPSRILACAYNIHHLNLSHNLISSISVGDFGSLYRLSVLDLSNNLITSIDDYSFRGMRVFHLKLERNLISVFGVDLFSGMALDGSVWTDEYRFCCLRPTNVPEENCFPKADQFSSCQDLIKNDVLRSFLWIIGFVALIGNGCVLIYKIAIDEEGYKKNYGVLVINLAVADILLGVYLLSIASVGVAYRGIYILKDAEWRNSAWCSFLGVLCTISCEASVFFICLITIDRYLIVKYPFGQVQIGRSLLTGVCVGIWIGVIVIAVIPLIITPYFHGKFFSKAGVCIALPLTTDSFDGYEYSFAISVCLNFILFLVVGVGQYLIYQSITVTQRNSLVSTRRNNDFEIARGLMYIVMSNFCCWFPICVMGILALVGVEIPSEVYAWVIVFVLPVNSALNPILYTGMAQWCKCKRNTNSSTKHTLKT